MASKSIRELKGKAVLKTSGTPKNSNSTNYLSICITQTLLTNSSPEILISHNDNYRTLEFYMCLMIDNATMGGVILREGGN